MHQQGLDTRPAEALHAAGSLDILVLAPGTLGRLGNYVSGSTLFLEELCAAHGDRVTVLSPERLWRNRGGAVYPRYERSGGFEIMRKGLDDSHVLAEDYAYFLERLEGRRFDVLLDLNDTTPEFRRILARTFDLPVILTVEQAGARAGLPLSPGHPGEGALSKSWRHVLDEVDAVVTWHINDIPRLGRIGDNRVPVHHIYYAVGLLRSVEEYAALPRDRFQGCCVGSLYAEPTHWKRSHELEAAVPLILERTPVREFLICGPAADAEASAMLDRIKARHGDRVRHIFLPGDRDASIAEIAKSGFLYNPIGGNQIGSTPVEAWATGTPLILTGSTFGEHLRDCVQCGLDDLPLWVNRLYEDKKLLRRITTQGKRNYEASFSPQGMARGYRDVIMQCLARHGRKPQ